MAITKIPAAGFTGNNFRNIIINGDMSIAQRGTSETGITSGGYYTLDRFQTSISGLGTWTQSQSTDVPTGQGFGKSLKMDCTTADASPSANDSLFLKQKIEGQNLQYLKKGTSSAESLTLSFWTKSNKTGTYCIELRDVDNSRQFSQAYTISSADTWEKKTLTFAGDTTGTLNNDNGSSLEVSFWLGAGTNFTSGTLQSWGSYTNANRAVGQVNLADSTANEWYITGVQLEAGTSASDFEFLPHDVNLGRCERYYEVLADGSIGNSAFATASNYSSTFSYCGIMFRTIKRATPSIDQTTGTSYYRLYNNNTNDLFDSFVLSSVTKYGGRLNNADTIGTNQGQSGWFETNNSDAFLATDAEL